MSRPAAMDAADLRAHPPSSPSDDGPAAIESAAWAPFGAVGGGPARGRGPGARDPSTSGRATASDSATAIGRYAVVGVAFVVLAAVWAFLRVQVDQLRQDIEKLESQRAELARDRDQLLLDHTAQRSVPRLEAASPELVTAPRRAAPPAEGAP